MKFKLTFWLVTLCTGAAAQSIERQIIGSAGFSAQLANNGMDCSVGEPMIAFNTSAENILSQGFLQPDIEIIDEVQNEEAGIFALYPNPTRDRFFLKSEEIITRLELIDASGRLVFVLDTNATFLEVLTGALAQGLYHLKITTANRVYSKKIQILP